MNVLSIQSHVVYGHVGNAAATFPLQRLGLEVWPAHTVQLSTHTGYPGWRGQAFEAAHLAELIEALDDQGLLARCDAVLSGYMGNAEVAAVILDAVARVKAANPQALYACDPVMGDIGSGLYVQPAIPEFMNGYLVPAADLVSPNLYELQLLLGSKLTGLDETLAAARQVIAAGPKVVLVTSLRLPETPPQEIQMLAVTAAEAWCLTTPFLDLDPAPNGAGDAVSALFLAHYLKSGDVAHALSQAGAAIFAVMRATQAAGTRELQLIAAQTEIVQPSRRFEAVKL